MNFKKTRLAQEALKNKSWYENIGPMLRMFSAALRGEYKMKKRYVILPILAIAYIVSPIDFIPGWFFPIIGLTDDIGVFVLTVSLLMNEVNRFLVWETEQKTGIKTINIEEK